VNALKAGAVLFCVNLGAVKGLGEFFYMQDEKSEADRRAFLERASQMAMTAPAAALLLAASQRQAMAAQYGGNGNGNK